MTYQEYVADPAARQRYWARSFVGFRRVSGARPNAAHRALTALQDLGLLSGLVTQNVDGLDRGAGTRGVIELHGGLDRVVCLGCGARTARARLEARLAAANPGWSGRAAVRAAEAESNADGDAELEAHEVAGFAVVACRAATACSSPTWSSSVRPSTRSWWPPRTRWWSAAGRCSCSARR
jgi:hypothetical protein